MRGEDPRLSHLDRSLAGVGRIIAVVSGKGGVGKSVISASFALQIAKSGKTVGVLDLDFQSPCLHIILGARNEKPAEDRGLVPPVVGGVKLMSVVYFSGDRPLPLKGTDVTDAFIELLTVTRWGKLDLLIIDAPPGMGDEFLDLIRLIRRAEFLVITTPSPLAMSAMFKVVHVLRESGCRLLGVIKNMDYGKPQKPEEPYLGSIHFDPNLDGCLGDPKKMLETEFSRELKSILKRLMPM